MAASLLRSNTKPSREIAQDAPSHLAKSLTVTGLVDTDGELHVHGNIAGRINADRLVLAGSGCIEGDVVAREVRIEGRLIGRVFALNVAVEKTAEITGRIFHHTVTVAFGARVEGRMPWRPLNYFETLDQLPETRP
jgi:cytoskeletal protein CcmA (bactofilin family)